MVFAQIELFLSFRMCPIRKKLNSRIMAMGRIYPNIVICISAFVSVESFKSSTLQFPNLWTNRTIRIRK